MPRRGDGSRCSTRRGGWRSAFASATPSSRNEDGRIRRFNTSILVEKDGSIVGKYRKVHLPGHAEHEPSRPFQHLEKRYFEVGNLGFPVFKAFGGTWACASATTGAGPKPIA